jgi:elongation factor G
MALEVVVPEPNLGAVLADLTVARQAAVKSVASRGAGLAQRHVVTADAPLAKLLGYATTLRSLTAGEGVFTMEYAHHAPLESLPPEDVPHRQQREGPSRAAALAH